MDFGEFVTEEAIVEDVDYEGQTCSCGAEMFVLKRLESTYLYCETCRTAVPVLGGEAYTIQEVLESPYGDGVVVGDPAHFFQTGWLVAMAEEVGDDVMSHPKEHDDFRLFSYDGLFVGYLAYNYGMLMSLFVVPEYRGQGLGTRFVEDWWASRDEEVLTVHHPGGRVFYDKLDIPIEEVR